jgi:HD domain
VAIAANETSFAYTLALPLIGLLALFAAEHRTQIDRTLELSHAYRGTAYLLGDVIEGDDAYTGSHSREVVELTIQVAQRLELDPNELRQAEFVALLHDVGKVRVPNEIINKPGPLTLEERGIINAHTIEGEKMLERVGGLLGEVGRLVRSRALRRVRLSRRPRRCGNSPCGQDRLPLRRLPRDDERPVLPEGALAGSCARGARGQQRNAVRPAGRSGAHRRRPRLVSA